MKKEINRVLLAVPSGVLVLLYVLSINYPSISVALSEPCYLLREALIGFLGMLLGASVFIFLSYAYLCRHCVKALHYVVVYVLVVLVVCTLVLLSGAGDPSSLYFLTRGCWGI